MAVGLVPDDQPPRRHADLPVLWAVDVHHRPRHRADVLGVHDRRPERGAVPASSGVATRNLTFFRQIGGSVGLAISGTVFGTAPQRPAADQSSRSAVDAGAAVPPRVQAQFAGAAGRRAAARPQRTSPASTRASAGAIARQSVAGADAPGRSSSRCIRAHRPRHPTTASTRRSPGIGQVFMFGVVTTIVAMVVRARPWRCRSGGRSAAPAAALDQAGSMPRRGARPRGRRQERLTPHWSVWLAGGPRRPGAARSAVTGAPRLVTARPARRRPPCLTSPG